MPWKSDGRVRFPMKFQPELSRQTLEIFQQTGSEFFFISSSNNTQSSKFNM